MNPLNTHRRAPPVSNESVAKSGDQLPSPTPPTGSWRDHVPAGHIHGDECLRAVLNGRTTKEGEPADTLLTANNWINTACTHAPAPHVTRMDLETQATHMQMRNYAIESLHEAQAELKAATDMLETAPADDIPDCQARVQKAEAAVAKAEKDLAEAQKKVDDGHADLAARLKGQTSRWHPSRANRLAIYAVMALVTLTYLGTGGQGRINAEYDRALQMFREASLDGADLPQNIFETLEQERQIALGARFTDVDYSDHAAIIAMTTFVLLAVCDYLLTRER